MERRIFFAFAALASAALLTACSSKDKGGTGPDTIPNPPAKTIVLSRETVTFSAVVGASVSADSIRITNTDTAAVLAGLALGATAYDSGTAGGWLTATLTGTSSPAFIRLAVTGSGMVAGTYGATIPVTASGASNSPRSLRVSLVLSSDTTPPPVVTGNVVLAVGNARCTSANIEAIARIVDSFPQATLIPLGDLTLSPNGGTAADFTNCYAPHLGRALSRTFAVLGSWEENDSGWAPGADAYFGAARVGPAGRNIFSFDIGTNWHVVMLNVVSGGVRTYGNNSFQLDWLISDLAANSGKKCTLAVWHDPMWYSTNVDPAGQMYPNEHPNQSGIWRELQNAHAELVLNGGVHTYERIGPLRWDPATAKPVADSVNGLIQFNSGLGGDGSIDATFRQPNSQYVSAGLGVLKLTLGDSTYAWEFINAGTSTVNDRGTGRCH